MTNTKSNDFVNLYDTVPTEYIIEVKFFDKKANKYNTQKLIRFGGLMYLADRIGMYRVQTSCIRATANEVAYEAKIFICPSDAYLTNKGITKDNPFIDVLKEPVVMHATATKDNVAPMMHKFLPELAETRSIVRALRLATGCPYTSVDELDRKDFKKMVEESGDISVLTVEEMIEEDVKSATGKTVSAPATSTSDTRETMIPYIKSQRKDNKQVDDYIKGYLDRHNAMIIENLGDEDLKTMCGAIHHILGV